MNTERKTEKRDRTGERKATMFDVPTAAQRALLNRMLSGPVALSLAEYATLNACLRRGWAGQQVVGHPLDDRKWLITDAGREALRRVK